MNGICLVSGGDEIRLRSYINHSIYAREHGLDYRLECGIDPHIRTRFDYKISIVRRLINEYDWLVWIDDDAYFTDFNANLINELIDEADRSSKFLVVANGPLEPNGFWSRINSGVFALKNCKESRTVLRLMETDLSTVREWWRSDRDGLFTSGDQDQLWWALNVSGLLKQTMIVDHCRWNSRGHYYHSALTDAFVVHFTGYPDKAWGVVRFAKRFGVSQELVPVELLDKYSVAQRSPMSDLDYRARSWRMWVRGRAKRVARSLGLFEALRALRDRTRRGRSVPRG